MPLRDTEGTRRERVMAGTELASVSTTRTADPELPVDRSATGARVVMSRRVQDRTRSRMATEGEGES